MPAKRYSAGAIFLQVVPVFANVQRAIESEAETWDRALSDKLEKSGEKAGEKAGKAASKKMGEELRKASGDFERDFRRNVDSINQALGGIDAKRLSNPLRKELASLKKEIAGFKDLDLAVDADMRKADAAIAVTRGRMQALRDDAKIVFRADFDKALKGFAKMEAAKEAISDPVEIEVRTERAERQMSSFERSIKKSMNRAAEATRGSLSKEVRDLGQELDRLGKRSVGVDISAGRLKAETAAIMNRLRALSDTEVNVDARFDAGRAWSELSSFMAAVEAADNRDIDIKANVETERARRNIFGLKLAGDDASNSFRSFNAVLLGVAGVGPAIIPMLGGIAGGLLALGPAAAVATTSLSGLLVGFSGIGDALDALGAQQDQSVANSQRVASGEQSSARAIANAQDALSDARRSAASAAEDAADRVRDAQKAAAEANRDAAEAVREARQSGAEAVEDAAERVADAREEAAEATRDALESQREAQEDYRDSVMAVRDAEQALREARANAAGTGADLERSIRENALAIDQALLDEFNTTVTYNATMADGSATNAEREQARIDMEEARLAMEELRAEQQELAEQKRKWDREGVNGTEEVQTAQDALTSAIDAQREAYEAMQKAARDADETRREGAERVADALAAQAEAQRDAAEAVQDALRAQAETRADGASNVRDAVEAQNETLADNRAAIQDAQQALLDARDSGVQSAQALNAQQIAVDNAFNKLGPAGRRFAMFLFGLQPAFQEFRNDIQTVLLPAIEEAMRGFMGSESASVLRDTVIDLAAGFGDLAVALSQSLTSKPWLEFFRSLNEYGPRIQQAYGEAFIAFLEGMASIMTILAPFALRFAEGFRGIAEAFAEWAKSKAGADFFTRLMGYIEKIGPKLLDFFIALSGAVVNLVIALAPYSEVILELLTHLLDFIANMDPELLGAITGAILILITASQIAYAVMNLILAGGVLLVSSIAAVVFALVAIGLAVAVLYKKNEEFRDFINEAWDRISAAFQDAWRKYIKPALDELWDALNELWTEVLRPFFAWLGPILVAFAERYIPFMAAAWGVMIRYVAWWIKNVFVPVLTTIGEIVMWVWNKVIKPNLPAISRMFRKVFSAIRKVWRDVLKPALDALGDLISWLWRKVIKPTLKWIGDRFGEIFRIIRGYWKNVLWPVLDLIGSTLAKLWKKVIKPTLKWIGDRFGEIFRSIRWVWKNILWPVLDLIGSTISKLWNKFVSPILGWIGDKFGKVFRGMRWVWNNILAPVFNTIKDTALPALKEAFRSAVDAIKGIWDDLKAAVGRPIKFIIETVINKGLIAGFNDVADFVNSTPMKEIPIPKWMQKLATGGVVGQGGPRVMPGYTPGRDVHEFFSPTAGRLSLSGGEAVMRPEFTRQVGGKAGVQHLNHLARTGELRKLFNGRDNGGFFMGGVLPLFGGALTNNHGSNYYGAQFAGDFNGPYDLASPPAAVYAWKPGKVNHVFYGYADHHGRYGNHVMIDHGGQTSLYAHLSSIVGGILGKMVSGGQMIGRVGDTGNSTGAHLHFEIKGGSVSYDPSTGGGPEGGGGGPSFNPLSVLPGWLKKVFKAPVDWVKDKITGAAEGITDKFGPFGTILKDLALKPAKAVGNKIKDIIQDFLPKMPSPGDIGDKLKNLFGGGKEGSVVDIVQKVAGSYGWGYGQQWSSLYKLIESESSWNPTVHNPDSSAAGLFQFIDSTWAAYSGKSGSAADYPVLEQAIAGMKYISARYGDPIGAWAYHLIHGTYEDGGVIGEQGELGAAGESAAAAGGLPYNGTMMYDAGGYLPPGLTTVVNLTGKPEPVFTNDQWSQMGSGGEGGNIHYEPHFEGSDLTAADVAGDLNFAFRKITRQGKYAGV